MGSMYSALLNDQRWKRKRLEVIASRVPECEWCGDGSCSLHVHHRYYEARKMPWDYPDESYDVLCSSCHAKADQLRREAVRAMGLLSGSELVRATAYMQAISATVSGPPGNIEMSESPCEQAAGMADAVGSTEDNVLIHAAHQGSRGRRGHFDMSAVLKLRTTR